MDTQEHNPVPVKPTKRELIEELRMHVEVHRSLIETHRKALEVYKRGNDSAHINIMRDIAALQDKVTKYTVQTTVDMGGELVLDMIYDERGSIPHIKVDEATRATITTMVAQGALADGDTVVIRVVPRSHG